MSREARRTADYEHWLGVLTGEVLPGIQVGNARFM